MCTAPASWIGSTSGMIDFVRKHEPKRVVLVTECSMADNVQAELPDVEFTRRSTPGRNDGPARSHERRLLKSTRYGNIPAVLRSGDQVRISARQRCASSGGESQ